MANRERQRDVRLFRLGTSLNIVAVPSSFGFFQTKPDRGRGKVHEDA
jgi:hypothetical protein